MEFLAETYYHSLSYLKSLTEFCEQVTLHVQKIEELFGKTPEIFRNTELIYSNEIAHAARLMGFRGILAEGSGSYLTRAQSERPVRATSFPSSDGDGARHPRESAALAPGAEHSRTPEELPAERRRRIPLLR